MHLFILLEGKAAGVCSALQEKFCSRTGGWAAKCLVFHVFIAVAAIR